MEDILNEVQELVLQGVKEFQVIAQELTYYGIDIDGKQHIAELVRFCGWFPKTIYALTGSAPKERTKRRSFI